MKKSIRFFLMLITCILFSSCVTVDSHAKMKPAPSKIQNIEIYWHEPNEEERELVAVIPSEEFETFYQEFNALPCYKDILLIPMPVGPAPISGYIVYVTWGEGYVYSYSQYEAARGLSYFEPEVWSEFIESWLEKL